MMMWATRLLFSLTTRRQHGRRRRCYCSVVPRCSASNNNAPSLINLASSSSHITRTYYFSKSLPRFSRSSNNSRSIKQSNNHSFLIPGFQPTIITGDNIGFYHGSTFYDGAPPNVLPILNASPILSPGKYVRQSSWSSADSKRGTKSGTDAALRLVDARREFTSLMNRELLLGGGGSQQNNSNHSGSDEGVVTDVRKIYTLTGHGVPSELLLHLIQVVRGWTASSQATQTHLSSIVHVSFQNEHNSTLLDRDQIQVIHDNGVTSKLLINERNHQIILNHGGDWEHDFDLYMVVMDRIASRLASFALLHPPPRHHHSHDDMSNNTVDGKDYNSNEDEATIGSSGSVITPASLKKWNVTMKKGEALPLSLLPMSTNERQQQQTSTILTVEWVLNKGKNESCNIILRLQDDGSTADLENGRGREPMSLVFDGMYV